MQRLRTHRRKSALISLMTVTAAALVPASLAGTPAHAAIPDCGPSPSSVFTTCVFHDDFAGGLFGTTLNGANWRKANMRFGTNCLKPANVTVAGGMLHLKSEVLATAQKCSLLDQVKTKFVGGSVTTDTKFSHTYGRIEFRAAMPSSDTFAHTALWMNPDDNTYGEWPYSGEIDVMERFAGWPTTIAQSLHYADQDWVDGTGPAGEFSLACTVSTPHDFHLYSVEWSSTRMKFFLDNQLCADFGWTPVGLTPPAPFDHPFNLIASQIAGGDESTPAGNVRVLRVDWVKFWSN